MMDEVEEEIRERIYEGDYEKGEILRKENIEKEFGIRRKKMREELSVMESEGMVIKMKGRGVSVE